MEEEFEVGDVVLVVSGSSRKITKVEKITPKGFIKAGALLYNRDGSVRGGDIWCQTKIIKLTPEQEKLQREDIRYQNLLYKLKKYDFEKLDKNKIFKIADIIAGGD